MKRIAVIAAALAALTLLTGCEEQDRKRANPVVMSLGTFDGCTVKYVDRGYERDSFFLARCGDTVATTGRVPSGKTTRDSLTITQEISKLEAERAAATARERALGKLSTDERKALGL